MKNVIIGITLALALAGCRRTDVRTFVVDVPGATEADVPALVAALTPYGGVDKAAIKFDAGKHKLTVKYDSMQIAKKNIEMAIAGAGFTANGVTPESIGKESKK